MSPSVFFAPACSCWAGLESRRSADFPIEALFEGDFYWLQGHAGKDTAVTCASHRELD